MAKRNKIGLAQIGSLYGFLSSEEGKALLTHKTAVEISEACKAKLGIELSPFQIRNFRQELGIATVKTAKSGLCKGSPLINLFNQRTEDVIAAIAASEARILAAIKPASTEA